MDAGNIDMAARDITHLSDIDKKDAVEAAYAIYETYRNQTGLRARRDGPYR